MARLYSLDNVNFHFYFKQQNFERKNWIKTRTDVCLLSAAEFWTHFFQTLCWSTSKEIIATPNVFVSFFRSLHIPGEAPSKHIYKIPLCNLVGRSIERPLKSPLVSKMLMGAAPGVIGPTSMISTTPSLSLSRMEIKEIASRTRKELLGEVSGSVCNINGLGFGLTIRIFNQTILASILHAACGSICTVS